MDPDESKKKSKRKGQKKVATKAAKKVAKPKRQRAVLTYMGHQFSPDDLLDFIELPQFTKRWNDLGLDDDADLTALQVMIMVHPKGGNVIQGTMGLRKMRFAPAAWNSGKSGAARVLYVHFEEFGIVLLCLVYGKDEMSTISDKVKKILNKYIAEIEGELRRRKAIRLE